MVRHVTAAALTLGLLAACSSTRGPDAGQRADLDRQAKLALEQLYDTNASARQLRPEANGILVFPRITQAGVGVGGAYGEGVLMVGGRPRAYYSVSSGNLGLILGAQSYSQAIFFMTPNALRQFEASSGWQAGVDGNIVAVNQGGGASVDITNQPIVGFIWGQQGLMVNASFAGDKYTRLPD